MQLVFNELSADECSKDTKTGIEIFERFLKAYGLAVKDEVGFSRAVFTTMNLNNLKIAENYYVSMWRNAPDTDRDLLRRFKGLCDRQVVGEYNDNNSEVLYNNKNGKGLLIAFENNMTLFSMCSNIDWEPYELQCEYYSLDTDEIQTVTIQNISSESQIRANLGDIEVRRKEELMLCTTAEDLFERLDTLFPSLIFHEVALRQIRNELEQQHVRTVSGKLYELEKYFRNWNGEKFDKNAFPNRSIDPQTKETLNRFKKEHTFLFEDGKRVIVSYHMRYTGNIPGRIYFHPDCDTKKAYICSLTTKLPTVSEPKMRVT